LIDEIIRLNPKASDLEKLELIKKYFDEEQIDYKNIYDKKKD
jgi:hypothetical protein